MPNPIDTTETGVKAKVGDKADIMAAWFYTDASDRMESTTSGYINTGSMRADISKSTPTFILQRN